MREIKFRLWSDNLKVMYTPNMEANMWEVQPMPNGICNEAPNDVLMQYTGLKDKNGKECYWDDWVTDGVNPKFLVTPDYHLLARLSEIEFEIVGNIYQNPELLKD